MRFNMRMTGALPTDRAPIGKVCRSFGRHTVGCLFVLASLAGQPATAQDKGSVNPEPLPPLAHPDDPKTPARELFGRKTTPASLQAHTIGFYSKRRLARAVPFPINRNT